MNKTQAVYALISSPKDVYLEEMWASIYSLRQYDPDREVRVVCDEPTANYVRNFPALCSLITEIVTVPVPNEFSAKLRSREIKTTIRRYIKGNYLYIDTDTIICTPLDNVDGLECSVAAVKEFNMTLRENPYAILVIRNAKSIFGTDISLDETFFNSGVMYVADDERAHHLYEEWHKNWQYSALEKGNSQDQPALLNTNHNMGSIIEELPGVFNCQPCMSVRHLHEARIVHYLHTYFPKDLSFSPFMDKTVYKQIKADGGISPETADLIGHCRSAYASPSCVVGWKQMYFMASPVFEALAQINQDGGPASWLLQKITHRLWWLHKLLGKGKH